MDLEQFFTDISSSLPVFEVRVILTIFLLLFFILLTIFIVSKSARKLNWTVLTNIILLLLAFAVGFLAFKTSLFPQNYGIYAAVIIGAALVAFDIAKFLAFKGKLPKLNIRARLPKKLKTVIKALIFIFDILLLLSAAFLVLATIFPRPFAVKSTPGAGEYLINGSQEIVIKFDLPVNQNELSYYISPEVKGKWIYNDSALNTPYRTEVRFIPEESFYPDLPLIIYISNLSSIASDTNKHEQSIELNTPKGPLVKSSNPADKSENFPTNSDIEIEYDVPIGQFANLSYEIVPKVGFTVVDAGTNTQRITFEQDLEQDKEYEIKTYRQLRSYKVADNTDIEVSDTETILDIKFKTVKTPGIVSYEPQGESANPNIPIKIVFQDEMNPDSVGKKLHNYTCC